MLLSPEGAALAQRKVLVLHLTDLCNVRCHYCYVHKKSKNMTLPVAKRAVDFFMDWAGGPQNTTVFYMGGEPLAVPTLLKRVTAYAADKGIASFGVISNGTLIDDKWIEYFASRRFFMHLSLDGVKEAQDANRPMLGGAGSFDKVDRALDLLGKAAPRMQHFELRHTFTPETLDLLAASFRYYASKDCSRAGRLCVMPAMLPSGRWDALAKSGELQRRLRAQFRGIADLYLETRREGRPLNLHYNECLSDTSALSEHAAPGEFSCRAGEITLSVNMEGEIFPCHAPAPLPHFRDNAAQKLGDVFTGVARPERSAAYLGGPVNVHHGCPHWNRLESGDPAKPATVYTALYLAWLEAAKSIRSALKAEGAPA